LCIVEVVLIFDREFQIMAVVSLAMSGAIHIWRTLGSLARSSAKRPRCSTNAWLDGTFDARQYGLSFAGNKNKTVPNSKLWRHSPEDGGYLYI
jgi:hypothetical protein